MPTTKLAVDEVKYIAIHCSATTADMNTDIADIDRWHRQRGFSKVGYHYFIKRNGETQRGRGIEEHGIHMEIEEGAHVLDYNRCAIGVCLAGGLDAKGKSENNFTEAQFASLLTLLTKLREWFPTAIIQGHHDFPNVKKDCPCFDVKSWCKTNFIT